MAPGSYPLLFGRFPNYYELLGIGLTATKKDVHTAYKKAALAAHPDKAGNTAEQNELCAAINNAKAVLIDEEQRRDYDSTLRSETGPQPSQVPPQSTKAPQQSEPASTSSNYSSKPKPETRPDGSKRGNGSTRWDSGSGPGSGSAFAGNTKPFGDGPGFGPERNTPREPKAESTHSSSTSDNAGTSSNHSYQDYSYPSAGCPICDSLWCPGAAHRRHAKVDEIPCNNRGPRGFASKSTFGHGQQEFSQSAAGCTRDSRCPMHARSSHGDADDRRWEEPQMMGDPNYIEPNCSPAFGKFAPPASAYDRGQHNGIKPDSASWRQARWRCFSLSEEHQSTVNVAFSLCNAAGTTERTGRDFVEACTRAQHRMHGEPLQRVVACVDLINEILYFVAAAYRFHALAVDGAAFRRPSAAIPQLMEIRGQLNVILEALSATNIFISCLAEKLCHPHSTDLTAGSLLDGLRSVLVEWDRSIILPDTLTRGAQEIIFSSKGCFQDSFRRLSGTTGYPCKPFIFKDRKPVQWSREAEEPTLRAWEAEQRSREGKVPTEQGFTPNCWVNGTGYYVNYNWSWSPAEDLDEW